MTKDNYKRTKIKYKNIVIFILVIVIISILSYRTINLKVKNIYIKGNVELTDQEIIDQAGLRNYPKIINMSSKKIKNELKNNKYIENSKIKINKITQEIEIEIEENIPILYYQYDETYLLTNGSSIPDKKYNLPVLINQTPDLILKKLLKKLSSLNKDVLDRISEIKYSPSNVDEELFLLTMNDGNYVYINFNSFSKLNDYIEFLKSFNNKKGILHLDSGDYLEVYETKKKK